MNKQLRLKDKAFELYIPEREIVAAIDRMAGEIRRDMEGRDPLYVGILNGAFMFVSELVSRLSPQSELTFAAYSSYHGTKSDGIVRELLPIRNKDTERPIVLLEDIIDTGYTLSYLLELLQARKPASLRTCVLLDKSARREVAVHVDYCGFSVPDAFVVGYGLDYAGRWRHLPDIRSVSAVSTVNS